MFAHIIPAGPFSKPYTYKIPALFQADVTTGSVVQIKLGRQNIWGVVWSVTDHASISAKNKDIEFKEMDAILPLLPISKDMLKFIDFMSDYTMMEKGLILKMVLPAATQIQKQVSKKDNARKKKEFAIPIPKTDFHKRALNRDQFEAAKILTVHVKTGLFSCFLLDGVTGAGKTEVYFEAVAAALDKNQQALILLPEISLSNSFIHRFEERFGCAPVLWHSNLTPAKRRKHFEAIQSGEAKVVVGARSALMLPYSDLGVIIVDEEHDASYKQEEGVLYHARDMAIARANIEKIPVILVSATPSLETMQNVWQGKYKHLTLSSRYKDAQKPDIQIIDLKEHKPERQKFLSPLLIDQMKTTLADQNQVLLFLNRRGYAPLTLCRSCGHRMECPRCTAWLVEHKKSNKLQCHHCGFEMKMPNQCPSCHDTGSLAACGPGVERIEEEVKELFPNTRIRILASDVTDTSQKLSEVLEDIRLNKVDIIIGTQIIAKGHHFPKLTCVGVVDGDLGLSGGDLRATERCYQLLHQVAGRAGREEQEGHVYIQTFNPHHSVMQLLAQDNRDAFLRAEAQDREQAHMPPFSRLAALILSAANENMLKDFAQKLGQIAPKAEQVRVLGPAPAQMYKIRNQFRIRFLLQADKNIHLQKYISQWLEQIKIPSSVKCVIDIDPQNFL
jgi:primosomal protein N' (replication factor Y) (superfamily II helicase)